MPSPPPAIATPTSAAASAGASLMPSPTITTGPRVRSASTASTLSAGVCSARTASTPASRPTVSARSAWSPVTSTMRSKPAARSRRNMRGDSARRGVHEQQRSCGTAGQGYQDAHAALEIGLVAGSLCPLRALVAQDPAGLAHRNRPSVDDPLDAVAVHLLRIAGQRQLQVALAGGADDGRGEDVRGGLVQAGRSREELVRVDACCDMDAAQRGATLGQGAGLVEQQHPAARELLQHLPALDHHAPLGGLRDPLTTATGTASSNGHGVATTSTATARAGSPLISHATPAIASDSG